MGERITGKRTQTTCVVFNFELRVRDSCGILAAGDADGRRALANASTLGGHSDR
jgi:hypothetical protein